MTDAALVPVGVLADLVKVAQYVSLGRCGVDHQPDGAPYPDALARRALGALHDEADPLELPAFAWGESVTWSRGRVLVPLNRGNETVADLVLDEEAAGTLAAMLDDAAGASDLTDWGEPSTQWACGVRKPDGSTILDESAPAADDETAVRAHVDAMQDGNGYRKALLRRDVSAWREVTEEPVARGEAERTQHSEEIAHVDQQG